MKFDELLELVRESPLFTSAMLMAGRESPEDIRRQLNRWCHAGKVQQLRRGVYVLAPPYAAKRPHPFVVANALRKGSYVSLQSALGYYGMIPEHVPVTTSVTTGRPERLSTPLDDFTFRHLKLERFFGYRRIEVAPGQHALLAVPEKALIDLLYFAEGSDQEHCLRELRVEKAPKLDVDELREMGQRVRSPKVQRALDLLLGMWEEEGAYETL